MSAARWARIRVEHCGNSRGAMRCNVSRERSKDCVDHQRTPTPDKRGRHPRGSPSTLPLATLLFGECAMPRWAWGEFSIERFSKIKTSDASFLSFGLRLFFIILQLSCRGAREFHRSILHANVETVGVEPHARSSAFRCYPFLAIAMAHVLGIRRLGPCTSAHLC